VCARRERGASCDTAGVKFRATVERAGKTATGIEVPEQIVTALGAGRRPAVKATINGYTYSNTVAPMGGRFMLSVSADVRAKAGIAAEDAVEVDLVLDTETREVLVPADLRAALDADPPAGEFFAGLSYSNQLRHVLAIDGAKAADTRARRIAKSVSMFHERRA